jgi:hypothetical protein
MCSELPPLSLLFSYVSWLKIKNPDFSQMAAGTPGTTMEDNEIPAAGIS